MNKKILNLLCAVLFLVLLNVGIFTFGNISITSFWISWAFIHLAFLLWTSVIVFSASEQKSLMFSYTEASVATYYFIVEAITGVVFAVQFVFFPVVAFAVQVILLSVFLCIFFSVKKMNANIDSVETVRQAQLYRFKGLVSSLKSVLQQVPYEAPYKKTVEHAYDAMAGSPMRSVLSAADNEAKIVTLIDQLRTAVAEKNDADICGLCAQIETEIAERNRKASLR